MNEDEIGKLVVDATFKIHSALGAGLLESIYESCLAHELQKQGLQVKAASFASDPLR